MPGNRVLIFLQSRAYDGWIREREHLVPRVQWQVEDHLEGGILRVLGLERAMGREHCEQCRLPGIQREFLNTVQVYFKAQVS